MLLIAQTHLNIDDIYEYISCSLLVLKALAVFSSLDLGLEVPILRRL